ncbi:hypothetical protein B0H63DRAFT_256950 [Podospora didyma]|uniref:LDB19 N-terminal domain-containing protein n=1 Tax=Podospora didyma TaxID=330526 RepID=A0AAE0N8L8_9PEZI|nr:hypothetical protein B0H63DRAFT_256950 [Podospora didyma]
MPHRVANFFRSSTQSLENQVSILTKKTAGSTARRRDSPSSKRRSPRSSDQIFTYASSIEDTDDSHAPPYTPRLIMGESRSSSFSSDSQQKDPAHHHRISFPGMHFGRAGKDSHITANVSLDWKLESPPIVLYGDAETSTGALVSGQLFLNLKEPDVEIESFNATLTLHVTQKKPYAPHCHDCAHQLNELKTWSLLPQPLVLTKGQHSFPFSVLLDGHLPATMDGPLVSIAYEFKAEAVPRSNGVSLPPIKFERVLDVKRSLPASELPHHSVRVFPPTNVKASAHFPHVIHPIGSNNLTLRLDGISRNNTDNGTIEYWKLKKLTWRLEETAKTIAPACARHCPKMAEGAEQEPPKKGMFRTDTRSIGEKTIFSGWKSNYSSATDSTVELELDYNLAKHGKWACDTKSNDGTEVTHQLMVEMVVSQEWAPANKPALVSHTGVGRILRMHFATILTERAGIGISWDNEAPPIYQDVPPSPPAYTHETFGGEDTIAEVIEPLDHAIGDVTQRRTSSEGR